MYEEQGKVTLVLYLFALPWTGMMLERVTRIVMMSQYLRIMRRYYRLSHTDIILNMWFLMTCYRMLVLSVSLQEKGETYYTSDHYKAFIQIRGDSN